MFSPLYERIIYGKYIMSTHMNTCEWPNCCSYQRDTEYGRVLYTPSVDNVEEFPLGATRRRITEEKGSFALRLPRIPWTYYKTGPVVAKRGLRCEPLARVVQDDSTTYYSVLAAANPCFPSPPLPTLVGYPGLIGKDP